MSKSILQDKKECWLCRHLYGCEMALEGDSLEKHHVMFGTADRDISERYGLTVWLCHTHHRTGMVSVHMNREANMLLRLFAQQEFEKRYSHEEWMRLFGKNYMEEHNGSDQDNN